MEQNRKGIAELKVVSLFETETKYTIDKPNVVADLFNTVITQAPWFDNEKECLVVILLNSKLGVKGWNLVTLGLQNQTLGHARECYRAAVVGAAAHIVLIHNHPSGNPSPSGDDVRLTRDLKRAGEVLGIPLIDHVVIGKPSQDCPAGFISMKQSGLAEF